MSNLFRSARSADRPTRLRRAGVQLGTGSSTNLWHPADGRRTPHIVVRCAGPLQPCNGLRRPCIGALQACIALMRACIRPVSSMHRCVACSPKGDASAQRSCASLHRSAARLHRSISGTNRGVASLQRGAVGDLRSVRRVVGAGVSASRWPVIERGAGPAVGYRAAVCRAGGRRASAGVCRMHVRIARHYRTEGLAAGP